MRGQTSAMADQVDLDWELRQLQRQARLPQQSWERGALATVFSRAGVLAAPMGEVPLPPCLPQRAGQGFAPMRAAYGNEEDNLKKQGTTKEKTAVLIQNTGDFKKTDEEARQAALEDWLDLVYKAGKESTLFEAASGGGTSEVKSSLADAMASKATGTLRRRAASLILFIDWCETNLHQPFPITEERVYSYAKHLEDSEAPATRASAFKEALNFAGGMLGLKGVSQAVLSPRVRGCVYNSIKRKRITVKKEPWTKEDIIKLEEAVISKSGLELRITLQEQVFLGFVLFLIHCRARFGDGARVKEEPYLDISGDQGFIEVSIVGGDTKTGKAANKVRRSMPIVGHAIGVTGQNWAGPWLAVRKRMGLDAGVDQTLMPRPLLDGSFVGETITTFEGGRWLRIVAQKIGISLENKGTHSCKATLLSWCAKAGVNHTSRRLLGGHAKPKDTSVLEYSRDALAGPLRDLGRVLDLVRSKRFQPDATRSGRWMCASAEKTITENQGDLGHGETEPEVDKAVSGEIPPAGAQASEEEKELAQVELKRCVACEERVPASELAECHCGALAHTSAPCTRACIACGKCLCLLCYCFGHNNSEGNPCQEQWLEEDIPSPEEDPEVRDSTDEEADEDVKEAQKLRKEDKCEGSQMGAFPEEGVWKNTRLGTLHRAPAGSGSVTACGFLLSSAECQVLKAWPQGLHRFCKRPKCFPK